MSRDRARPGEPHTSRDDCQLRRVAELVGARRGPLPAIVGGDFNTQESAGSYAELLAAGFIDAFRAVNPGATGHTSRQQVHAAGSTVSRRIDFVFVAPGAIGAPRVLEPRGARYRPPPSGRHHALAVRSLRSAGRDRNTDERSQLTVRGIGAANRRAT